MRYVLVSVLMAFGLLIGSPAWGSAAVAAVPRAAVTFGAGAASSGSTSSVSSTPEPCRSGDPACASSNQNLSLAWSSATSTAGCRFRLVLDWGDGAPAQTVDFAGSAAKGRWTVAHAYPIRVSGRHAYRISATAAVAGDAQARGCSIESAAVTFDLLCNGKQLSGVAWNARWPGGDRSIGDLNAQFRPRVEVFVAAMAQAGITVQPQSTLRSPERAYLMHFSYLVAKGLLAPQDVPAYVPIAGETAPGVCWLHRTATGAADPKASVTAAAQLLSALGVDTSLRTPPALRSRHITGDAVDMQLSWSAPAVTVEDATGRMVKITSKPHDGTNPDLIAVGAGYGVDHFSPVSVDRNHWSSDGH